MKRGRKATNEEQRGDRDLVKSTYLLDRSLKQNLVIAAMVTEQDQADIVRTAIVNHLREMGIEHPEERPALPDLANPRRVASRRS